MSDTSPDIPEAGPASSGNYVVVGVFPGQPDRVVREAAVFAARFQAELVCAQVEQNRYLVLELPDGTISSLPFDPDLPELQEATFDPELEAHLVEVLGTTPNWSTRALAGEPAEALGRLADTLDAAMIVVGTRRRGMRSGVGEFFAGSVAVHLAHRQRRPVVVIPLNPVAPDSALPWEPGA
jgi:nucleotide-binding universal stress UspA family protein